LGTCASGSDTIILSHRSS